MAKAQTSIIMILLVIMVFIGMIMFLLSLAKTVSREEYMNLYVHNLLVSILRSDTGDYSDYECKTVADALMCAFRENKICPSGKSCREIAEDFINESINKFKEIKGYRYLFIARPSAGWIASYKLEVGDSDLLTEKVKKITANEKIQRGDYILDVTLIISK